MPWLGRYRQLRQNSHESVHGRRRDVVVPRHLRSCNNPCPMLLWQPRSAKPKGSKQTHSHPFLFHQQHPIHSGLNFNNSRSVYINRETVPLSSLPPPFELHLPNLFTLFGLFLIVPLFINCGDRIEYYDCSDRNLQHSTLALILLSNL
jgi:hypothetical protein